MAIINGNILLVGLRGLLGDQLLLRRDKAGRTIVSVRPRFDPHRKFSLPQIARHNAFREAAAYAMTAKNNPLYLARTQGTPLNAYNLAISDWLRPPEILDLDPGGWTGQPGQLLRVTAVDNVLVTDVSISITLPDGALVEQGPATQLDDLHWEYRTTRPTAGPLLVTALAHDLPGHAACKTRHIA